MRLCKELTAILSQVGIKSEAGIGRAASSLPMLAESAHLAREALSTGRALGLTLCPASALSTEMLLSYLPAGRKRRHIEQVLKGSLDDELVETFLAWCEAPFDAQDVSARLSIHRNTLQYRLKKIRELLGLDPWNFHDSFALWSALILRKFSHTRRESSTRPPEQGRT